MRSPLPLGVAVAPGETLIQVSASIRQQEAQQCLWSPTCSQISITLLYVVRCQLNLCKFWAVLYCSQRLEKMGMGVVETVQIPQATRAFHSLDSPSAQIQFSTSRGWTEGEEQPHSLRFEFWLKYLSELLSSVRILVQTCAIGTAEVSEMGNYTSRQLGWTDCCIALIYGPELNPQGKSEQRKDCVFFFSKASGCKPYFASNHGVYGHVLLETCCFSQRFLSDCLSKTASGNDKHTAVNLKSSVQP